LSDGDDEQAILAEADRRRIALTTMSEHQLTGTGRAPTLLLGYSQSSEATIRLGVRELAAAIQTTRTGS
jgi:DNA-binding transcriptional MocR family regulator